ncbi:pentatricopeptide repeat-containing-like protein [Cinnamomum micranthum f. kanehirae]|uniref:Pentatricopeptide repeat-containing-like protein n=1 Tax=Cinnamomum micranthum f. kanehirae TaxID=337451 RepID=A0A3S3N7C6_9MAGN|nr:pentatricopeptide repeat-containing-like protein [Cinnamomum micranthum f. kanehirae]
MPEHLNGNHHHEPSNAAPRSGSVTYARSIFDSLHNPNSYFSNTLLRAYAKSPDPNQALLFFIQLLHQHRHHPDRFTYPFLLQSCSHLHAARQGKQLHASIYKARLHEDRFIQNSLIHMYSICGELNSAMLVFDQMPVRDVVSWTSIIDGCVDSGYSTEALKLFEQMEDAGVAPNDATAVSVLRACADVGAMSVGQRVHQIINQCELDSKPNVVTALIDMYSKCGCIDTAGRLFDELVDNDVFAWTAMISGLASHGRSKDAIELFHRMQELNIRTDDRTITAVLSACRSAGWVSEGWEFFNSMEKNYKIRPKIQHYGCMVDLFARAGHLNEAEELIKRMPIESDAILWRTLIWACKIHGDINRGERLMKQRLLKMGSIDCGSYVLLGNMYASAGKWREKARVRGLMTQRRIEKSPGRSKIEVNGTIHEFVAGDSGHPEAERIYGKWDEIAEKLRLEGYQPKLSEVLLDIEDSDKASQLQHHSEKLAVAFGLISTNRESKILVVKNLRSCEDCHSAMKFVSKIFQREIIIRDRIRFHHFKNGVCSCGDYW